MNEQISSIGSYLKIIGICYYAIVLKEHKYTTHNFFIKTHFVQKQKILYFRISVRMLILKKQGIVCDLSMMRKSHKLTKRTTKTEKTNKSFKILSIYDIIKFKTILYKLTASGNIIYSIFNYKLMRMVNTLRLPKE